MSETIGTYMAMSHCVADHGGLAVARQAMREELTAKGGDVSTERFQQKGPHDVFDTNLRLVAEDIYELHMTMERP